MAHRLPLVLAFFCFCGCSSSEIGKVFPVKGKITLNSEVVNAKTTTVLFVPDTSRGNTTPHEPVGTVDENGVYHLSTRGHKGAPPGWYKVIVTAYASPPQHPSGPRQHRPVTASLIPEKYGTAATTPLAVEVVETPAPDAYDLILTK
jgi:hypothetical protein